MADGEVSADDTLQVLRRPGRRERSYNPLRREEPQRCGNWRSQVAIRRNQEGGVEPVLKGVGHHLHGNIDISHLFVVALITGAATTARSDFALVLAEDDLHFASRKRLQRVDVRGLAAFFWWIVSYPRGKVFDLDEGLVGFEEMAAQTEQIQPVEPSPALGLQPKVKIESIDIDDYTISGQSGH